LREVVEGGTRFGSEFNTHRNSGNPIREGTGGISFRGSPGGRLAREQGCERVVGLEASNSCVECAHSTGGLVRWYTVRWRSRRRVD